MKSCSYALGEKVWLNSKHIKMKWHRKLKAKIFGFLEVFHPIGKQAYKLERPAKWRIYDMFHVLVVKQDITRKGRMNEFAEVPEFEPGNNKEYKIEAI